MRKAAFHNLGCKVNSWETEAMEQMLAEAGYEIVPFTEKADVYIINTCSVTNVADKKSRQMLHRAKKMNPDAAVVAAGCYVQSAGEALQKDDAVDIIIGNDRKKELPRLLDRYFEGQNGAETGHIPEDGKLTDVIDIAASRDFEDLHISHTAEHTRAFMKIQDGCNQFCSYCIIPYTRGRIRSRDPEEVLWEAETLVQRGYREIVLTGIHLSSYGLDFGHEEYHGESRLMDLLERVDRIPGLLRMRLGSLEPRIVTEEFARRLAGLSTICPHFHLSLQSGCGATLKRMNRHYTPEEYRECCERLRRYFDHPAITTDVIVGFPGETEEEFEASRQFVEDIGFYELHVFRYSRRKGTRADRMPDQVPETVKAERSDVLLDLDRKQSAEFRRRYLGEKAEILMEEPVMIGGRKYMVGHTREYVKGAVPFREGLKNRLVTGIFTGMLSDEVLLAAETGETESLRNF